MTRSPNRGDPGETLIEILISIIVIGITVSALIGGLTLALTASDTHRRLTNVEVVARAYGELVLEAATHRQSTTMTVDSAVNTKSLTVASTAGFTSGAMAAVDGEVVEIDSVASGTILTLKDFTREAHATGSMVILYQSCPTATDLAVGFTPPAGSKLAPPVITDIEFFDRQGKLLTVGCDKYWESTGLPCSVFEKPREHLTQCDPALIRVTIDLASADAASGTGAGTTTRVLIRRGNE